MAIESIAESNLVASPGGPDALFAGKENVIEGIFEKLNEVNDTLQVETG